MDRYLRSAATYYNTTTMATEASLKSLKDSVEPQLFDITKSLGLTREKQQYDSRLKALTDPTAYAKDRETEWKSMVSEVKIYFNATVNYLSEAGFDWEES